ncbi:MAG: shikimate kinase [Thermoplasmataceae archaeon]
MRDVEVRCHGGISIISAFAQRFGASVSIGLEMVVRFSSAARFFGGSIETEKTLELLMKKYPGSTVPGITIESDIPQGQGLKSSSAFTLALVVGFTSINGVNISELEILRLAAEASIANGTSITGAFDDLCSSYYGGVCLTDNASMDLLKRYDSPGGHVLIAYNPERYRITGSMDISALRKYSESFSPLRDLVMNGYPLAASLINGHLIGEITGMNIDVMGYFREKGASYVSQSGKGPAVFAVFHRKRDLDDAIGHFPTGTGYRCISTEFTNEGIRVSGK